MAKIEPVVGVLEESQALKLTDLSIQFGGLKAVEV